MTRIVAIAAAVLVAFAVASVALFRLAAAPNPVGRWQSPTLKSLTAGRVAELELFEGGRAKLMGIDGEWSQAMGGDVNIRFDKGGLATVAILGTDRTLNLQWKGEALVIKRNAEILGEFHRMGRSNSD